MSQETYQQLRQEFQELRHQYEQNTFPRFCIEFSAPSGWSSAAHPPFDAEKFQYIASVCLPFEAGYVPSPVQDDEVGLFGIALAPKAKATEGAVTRFIELSRTAGENLPGDITHSLKGLSSDLMDDPISKWLALLIVLNDCHRGDSVIIRPFLNSIEAIDRCKLGTAQASLHAPTAIEEKPQKKKRGRPKADYEQQQQDAKDLEDWERARDSGISKDDYAKQTGRDPDEFKTFVNTAGRRKRRSDK